MNVHHLLYRRYDTNYAVKNLKGESLVLNKALFFFGKIVNVTVIQNLYTARKTLKGRDVIVPAAILGDLSVGHDVPTKVLLKNLFYALLSKQ